jgi:mono/diheme cytochrome c family protein
VANRDPAVIARGRYLALSGGREMKLPVGIFRPANLTADVETGIGGLSDGQIARSLRHGVRHDGKAMLPFMPFANLSDEDLTALISFLRAQPPVHHPVETRSPNLLGHVVMALLIRPEGPTGLVPRSVPPAATAAYGKYLAHRVANCVGCHTRRDMRTGAYVGAPFAGGMKSRRRKVRAPRSSPPNLTFARTGRITSRTEELFVARVPSGNGADGSPMPWAAFARMTDNDLAAITATSAACRPSRTTPATAFARRWSPPAAPRPATPTDPPGPRIGSASRGV